MWGAGPFFWISVRELESSYPHTVREPFALTHFPVSVYVFTEENVIAYLDFSVLVSL